VALLIPLGLSSIKLTNSVLILLLLTAFALRLYRIDHQELWGDEARSAYVVKLPLPSIVSPYIEPFPPFYHLLLYFWVRLTGSSVFTLRFLSLVLGVLTVPLVYRLARLASGVSVGLLAALLWALSPFQVYYSQEARMYALVGLSTTLSMLLFVRIVAGEREQFRLRRFSDAVLPANQPDNQSDFAGRETNGNLRSLKGLWVGYLVSTAAAIFSHYYALFVVVAQNVLLVALWRRDRVQLKRWFVVQAVLVLMYLPWVLAQRGFLSGKASARFNELTLPVLLSIVKKSLVAFSVGTTVQTPLAYYLTLTFLLLAALGLVATVTVQPSNLQSPMLLLAWLVIPLIFAWLVNPIMPFFQERYLLVVAPAFIILVAVGLSWIGDRSPWALALGLLFVVSASSVSLHNWFFDHAYTKGEYKLTMDYVRDHAQQGDLLLLNNPLQEALFDYYRPPGVPYLLLSRDDLHTEDRADRALAALTEGYSRVWLVMFGYLEQYDPNHLAERWLNEHGYRSSYRSFLGAYLTLYVMSPADASFPMQHTVAANLDSRALLIGYGLGAQEIEAGGTIRLTLYWQALAEIDRRYTVFVHLLDADNRIVAQMDSEPLGGTHPTTEWQLGEIVRDNYGLLIAPGTPPGEYLLEVGMYYLPTMSVCQCWMLQRAWRTTGWCWGESWSIEQPRIDTKRIGSSQSHPGYCSGDSPYASRMTESSITISGSTCSRLTSNSHWSPKSYK
jgi:4-amino-4-deoxy-L-arabinose transferase-like glycosyltransferase